MNRRRGASLVEMLVVMSAASTVLTLSAVLIHRTMRVSSRTEAMHAEETTAWRLSSQLRRDAVSAASIDLGLANDGVTLTLRPAEGEPVQYRFSGPTVERRQRLAPESLSRESFSLPSVADWTVESLEQSDAVQIEAVPSTMPTRSPAPAAVRLIVHAGAATEAPR